MDHDFEHSDEEQIVIPPPPRKVKKDAVKGVADLFLTILGSVFGGIGLIVAWFLVGGLQIDIFLDITGKTVAGEAIELAEDTSYSVNGEYPVKITYTYEVDGQTFKGRSNTTDWPLVERLEKDPKLKIEYASSNPKLARIEGTTRSLTGYAGLFILLFPGIGFGLLAVMWINRWRRTQLYRNGEGVIARIESIGLNHSVTINGRHPTLVRWSFDVRNTQYEGKWSGFKMGPLKQDATKLPVLYDPKNPRRNIRFWG